MPLEEGGRAEGVRPGGGGNARTPPSLWEKVYSVATVPRLGEPGCGTVFVSSMEPRKEGNEGVPREPRGCVFSAEQCVPTES